MATMYDIDGNIVREALINLGTKLSAKPADTLPLRACASCGAQNSRINSETLRCVECDGDPFLAPETQREAAGLRGVLDQGEYARYAEAWRNARNQLEASQPVTLDSGRREEFSTGSRRDTREGKGRFDLLPWEAIERLALWLNLEGTDVSDHFDGAIDELQMWRDGVRLWDHLAASLAHICWLIDPDYGPENATGYSLVRWNAIERWAQLLERGALKYGERNWELGQPLERYFDSAIRHLVKWQQGETTEDHLAAALFNVGAIMFTEAKIAAGELPKELSK